MRVAATVALILILLIGVAAVLLYLNRRAVARDVLVGWLDQRGIPADVEVERVELDGFVGRIRIGDPNNPDVTVERAEVDYAVAIPGPGRAWASPPAASVWSAPWSAPAGRAASCPWGRWIPW